MTVRPRTLLSLPSPLRLLPALIVLVAGIASGSTIVGAETAVAANNIETVAAVGADADIGPGHVGSNSVSFDDWTSGCCVAPNNVLPEFTQKQYVRPGGGSRPGTGTVGMVELDNGTGALLQSGRAGPASAIPRGTPGFNGITKTHVEGHAAALMRQTGVQDATLWINRVPCPGVNGCGARLPGMLPEGGRLRILGPDGYDEVFTGVPD